MDSSGALAAPTSFRLMQAAQNAYDVPFRVLQNTHESHPSLPNLVLLVFEAVLEVVCVSLPGYIIARMGHFDAEKQKFLANLNIMLFTPCLIFIKLGSQLNAKKFSDLAIIPVIFVAQTLVSWVVSILVSKMMGFNKRASNFVTAMGVFGNSNSLPISLILSLSQTLKGLHWDKLPGDNDDEVGARGILYLLIFQQLGQVVRWSWGFNVLLAPKESYPEYQSQIAEEGQRRHSEEHDPQEAQSLIAGRDGDIDDEDADSVDSQHFNPAGRTPVANTSRVTLVGSSDDDDLPTTKKRSPGRKQRTPPNERAIEHTTFPHIQSRDDEYESKGFWGKMTSSISAKIGLWRMAISDCLSRSYQRLPQGLRNALGFVKRCVGQDLCWFLGFHESSLWAMLFAIIVASVPTLQRLFFEEAPLFKNSVTSAIRSNGNVAVPLILVVLGANLARSTSAKNETLDPEEERIGTKLLVASLACRMILPTLIMAPILALFAKYLPISILDDPIFVIVCFLLTGAPSALQLAQICQLNDVYQNTMGKLLFQSYVVWILPSTLILVMVALEVVEWAR